MRAADFIPGYVNIPRVPETHNTRPKILCQKDKVKSSSDGVSSHNGLENLPRFQKRKEKSLPPPNTQRYSFGDQ